VIFVKRCSAGRLELPPVCILTAAGKCFEPLKNHLESMTSDSFSETLRRIDLVQTCGYTVLTVSRAMHPIYTTAKPLISLLA